MRIKPYIRENKEYESNLGEVRLDMGLTIKEFCELCKISSVVYHGLQSGTRAPFDTRDGKISKPVERILDITGLGLEAVFPRYACDYKRHNLYLTDEQKFWLMHNNQTLVEEEAEIREILNMVRRRSVGMFTDREEELLTLRFCECWTLEECGEKFGVTKEMARYIEFGAMEKIKSIANEILEEDA